MNNKTKYEARGWLKYSMQDDYSEGCDPETATCADGKELFSADTIPELIYKLMSFAGTLDENAVEVNACGEVGQINIQVQENGDGYTPTTTEIEDWKQNKVHLWQCDYSYLVERVTREAVTISEDWSK